MHGRDKTAAAPASDAATRERRRCLRVAAVSGETAETHRYRRRTGRFRPKFKKKKRDVLRYVGDVRECLCVRQRENERENKLNKYLSAFGIRNQELGLVCGYFVAGFFLCIVFLF